METHRPNDRLRTLMKRAGMSNSGLAARVCALGADHDLSLRYNHISVRAWLEHGRRPKGATPYLIAEVLSRKLGQPVTIFDIGFEDTGHNAAQAMVYPEGASDSFDSIAVLLRSDLSRSKTDPASSVQPEAWNELMVRWLLSAQDDEDELRLLTRDDVSLTATAVESVRATTRAFSELDYQFGGGHARSAVLQYLSTDVTPLLRAANPASPVGRDLLAAGAALLRLVGWTAYDIGLHGAAQGYLTQALRLAAASGDRALGGRVLAGMSHQANFLGYHDQAVNLARSARRGAATQATPTAFALFAAMEARALAAKGDEAGCLAALRVAESSFEQREPKNDPTWLTYFDEAELAAEFAHCFRDLGRGAESERWAAHSVDSSKSLYVRSLSFCRTVLATAHIQQGKLEQGLAVATGVVEGTAALRSVRCRAYVLDFTARLDIYSQHQPVASFIEQTKDALARSA